MMHLSFEEEKNRKALFYTLAVCSVILLLAFTIRWKLEIPPQPVPEDFIEVNLGNEMEGEGTDQPLIKGDMAANADPKPVASAEPTAAAQEAAPEQQPAPDENALPDEAPVNKPVTKPVKKTAEANPVVKPTAKPKTTLPVPAAPTRPARPLQTYKGPGSGKGNGATEDNGFTSQGTKKGGGGDNGLPTGKPDSYGNHPGGKTGVSVTRGIPPLNLGQLRFEDDFNENAKVYLDVRYNASGGFISATAVKPTTTTNSLILSIARRKASSLKFPPSDDGGITTILFNFKVQ